jgi:DGQHR domain-containing protein
MQRLTYTAIRALQSDVHSVLSISAPASEILKFASIDRVARNEDGALSGFQRPQIAAHIREIKDYLEKPDAILPNPIVVAFTQGVEVKDHGNGTCEVSIDVSEGPSGLVVDGQQRLSALSQITGKDFRAFVSLVICRDESELRRQFVLINNTRPLPKSLVYELLPGVQNLPDRLDSRSLAAELTDMLNYSTESKLYGQIKQHTNPKGLISDTAIQRVIMNSLSDGVLRSVMRQSDGKQKAMQLISAFYGAIQEELVFGSEWAGHTPKTSRLVHGAGIAALGYVMEVLATLEGASNEQQFAVGLAPLIGRTAWTSGEWHFGKDDRRHWKAIQNVGRDVTTLGQYLVSIIRADIRARRSHLRSVPLFEPEAV